MTKHVISKKGILRTSRAQWIFPGFLLPEQRDEQSVMGQSVCLFTSAHQSCSAVRYHSTAAHWAHPNLPQEVWIIWSYALLWHPPCLESQLCVYEQTTHSPRYDLHTYTFLNRWIKSKIVQNTPNSNVPLTFQWKLCFKRWSLITRIRAMNSSLKYIHWVPHYLIFLWDHIWSPAQLK